MMIFSELEQILLVVIFFLLQSLDSGIHINSESNNDIEADNDTEVVEDDKVVAIDGGA